MKEKSLIKTIAFGAIFLLFLIFAWLLFTGDEKTADKINFKAIPDRLNSSPKKEENNVQAASPLTGPRKESHQEFLNYFGDTPTGVVLSKASSLIMMREISDSKSSQNFDLLINQLQRDPEDTFEHLKDSMDLLPSKFNQERRLWLQFVKDLDVSFKEKALFFENEAKRTSLPSEQGDNPLNNSIALEMLIDLHKGDQVLLHQKVKEIFKAQRSHPSTLETLYLTYFSQFPREAEKLKSKYLK